MCDVIDNDRLQEIFGCSSQSGMHRAPSITFVGCCFSVKDGTQMKPIAGFLSRSCHVLTIEELAREASGTQKSHKHWVYMVGATGIEPVTPAV